MTDSDFHSDSSARRMFKNGSFVAVRFALYTLSGIIFIPYLVRKFGSGTYGLIALAGFLTQYVGLLSKCVGNAVARFLNISLNQNNWQEANEIFSTALVANICFVFIQLPFFALGLWKLDVLIDFPPEIGTDFRILVGCNIVVFLLSLVKGVIRTPIQAANRLDLSAGFAVIWLFFRIVLLFTVLEVMGPKLWLIGIVDLGLALADSVAVFSIYRKLAKHLVFKWKYVSRKWFKPVLTMTGWSIVSTLGGYLLLKTDVWMINRFVSNEMAGIYAALLIWPNYLKQISKQLASVLNPVYMIDYAKGDNSRVAKVSLASAKVLGWFVGICSGILCVAAKPLLTLWLGKGAEIHAGLFRIMVSYMAFVIDEAVLWQVYVALNKVHISGIINLISGLLNIGLSLFLIHMGYGAKGVAISTVVAMTLSSALAIPLGVCREFKVPFRTVLWNYASAAMLMLLSATATHLALRIWDVSIVYSLAVFCGILTLGLLVAYRVFLSSEDKRLIGRLIQAVRIKLRIA